MRIQARHYVTSEPIEIHCEGGVIQAVGSPTEVLPDLQAGWAAPALFDLQINGCGGHSFNSETLALDGVRQVVDACRRHGIASFCPTLITNTQAALIHGFETLAKACDSQADLARAMPCFHLEGPYISDEDGPRGAHPRQHVRPANWEEFCLFQEAAGGRIRLVTLAPEQPGAVSFIERVTRAGVVAAIGHTAATGECIREAIAAGARLSTHLGNGSHAMLPRHNNYIWEQLAADALWASIICDGQHLPPAVVRCIVRVKSTARIILTCDASSLAGLPSGKYREWDQEFEVRPEGKVVVSGTDYLAGSWAFTDLCIGNLIRFAKVTLHEAVDSAGARPRELLGLPPLRLEAGFPADLVLFDWQQGSDFKVSAILVGGVIHRNPPVADASNTSPIPDSAIA